MKWFFIFAALIAVLQFVAVTVLAFSLSKTVVAAISREPGWTTTLIWVVGATLLRGGCILLWEVVTARAAAGVKSELRARLLYYFDANPAADTAARVTLMSTGIDALDGYFAKFLPQLILTAVLVPALLAVVGIADPLSGLILLFTLPLIPVFMILIGWATQTAQRKQWAGLNILARAFVDLVGGLRTLRIYRREQPQIARIRVITEDYRRKSIQVLRISFLSGFVLEIVASLAIAVVAVEIGLRLVGGQLDLFSALFVLLLTPEIFLPLRAVGGAFHSAAPGVAAIESSLEYLEVTDEYRATPAAAGLAVVGVGAAGLGIRANLATARDHQPLLAVSDLEIVRSGKQLFSGVDLVVRAGEMVVLRGASGVGKSSIFEALLGFIPSGNGGITESGVNYVRGTVTLTGVPVAFGASELRAAIAWSSQSAMLIKGTVAENVTLGAENLDVKNIDSVRLRRALELTDSPAADQQLYFGGGGLSGGEAQRLAAARAIYRLLAMDSGLLLLDEPSSALDPERERHLSRSLRTLAAEGYGVLVISHREILMVAADQVVTLGSTGFFGGGG